MKGNSYQWVCTPFWFCRGKKIKKNQTNNQIKKKKKILHIKVHLQFLEAGPSLVQSWHLCNCACTVTSVSLPPAPSFTALHHSAGANLRDVSPPPREALGKPRTEAVSHTAQEHELLLQKHQAVSAGHAVLAHPLWTGHSWDTQLRTHPHAGPGSLSEYVGPRAEPTFECGDSSQLWNPAFAAERTHCHAKHQKFPSHPRQTSLKFPDLLNLTHL